MKAETKNKIRIVGLLLFILYLVALFYFLFFAESYGRVMEERSYSYNLEPFKEINRFWVHRETLGIRAVLLNLVGNVLGFVPFGAILPVINSQSRSFFKILLLSFEFSFIVESIQLVFKVGSFDVDDILLNTLGGILGYLIFVICNRIRRRKFG